MTHPLESVTILDLGQNITGPVACLMLRALGAEVIKVELPGVGDYSRHSPPYAGTGGLGYDAKADAALSLSYLKRNRGKSGVTLNLKHQRSRRVFDRLVEEADVVVENFRPGVLKSLGYDFESLTRINPRINLCSITGFGDSDRYGKWLAYDGIVQAFSGVVQRTGYSDQPPVRPGFPVADGLGALFGTIGVLAALSKTRLSGEGTHVKVSMLDCVLFMLWDNPEDFFAAQGVPPRFGNWNGRVAPWDMYEAKDGQVVICAMKNTQWKALCQIIGIPKDDPRFKTGDLRLKNRDLVDKLVGDWCRTRPKEAIAVRLQEAGIPCSAVRRPIEVPEDPEIKAAGTFGPVLHPTLGSLTDALSARFPLQCFDSSALLDTSAPMLGQDNERILARLGFSPEETAELLASDAM